MSEQGAGDPLTYTYRPSLIGATWTFGLADDGLHWSNGRLSGRIGYDEIKRIRLSYRPGNMQTLRFMLQLWSANAPKLTIVSTSWKSMVEVGRGDREYRAFVLALHRRLATLARQPELIGGINPVLYWSGVAVLAGTLLGLAALLVRALQNGVGMAALLVAAFGALFLWQGGNFFRRNKPVRYSAGSVPPLLLPPQPLTTSTEHLA